MENKNIICVNDLTVFSKECLILTNELKRYITSK